MNQITIPLRYLLAVRLFAAKSDTRFYLQGVAVKDGHVVGTDGTYVGAIRCDAIGLELPEIIIPTDAIDFYGKKAKRSTVKDVTITWEEGTRNGTLTNGTAVETFTGIEGAYPPFQRILQSHTRPSGHPQFQAPLLVQFEKAATELGTKGVHKAYVIPNGDSATARVILPGHPEFHGAVSPLRYDEIAAALNELEAGALV